MLGRSWLIFGYRFHQRVSLNETTAQTPRPLIFIAPSGDLSVLFCEIPLMFESLTKLSPLFCGGHGGSDWTISATLEDSRR